MVASQPGYALALNQATGRQCRPYLHQTFDVVNMIGFEGSFSFATMVTTQFSLTSPYLQKCLQSDDVRHFLQVSRYRKPVCVITGLKIVTEAKADTLKSHTTKGNLSVKVDGTVWSCGAVPVRSGLGLESEVKSNAITNWDGSDDFGFAFRVTRVFVSRSRGQVMSEEEYCKGAMLEITEERVGAARLSVF